MMRVLQVVPVVDDASAGTTYALNRVCEHLAHRGLDIELHALNPVPRWEGASYRRIGHARWRVPAPLGVSTSMRDSLKNHAMDADIVHNNGLWMMPNVYAGSAARYAHRPLVYSTHGMLAPWALARSRWKKTLFSFAGQRRALDSTTCFHVTAQSEYREIRQLGYRQPVAIVPFGIDIPAYSSVQDARRRRLLFLSRIHPKKGIDVLLRAWSAVEAHFSDWDLQICGPDNCGHLSEMRELARRLNVRRVDFLGPKYGQEKEDLFNASELFVLPTFNENFGFVVAEALAHAKPAIVTNAAPWRGLEIHRCGWWIETGTPALEDCLRQALAMQPDILAGMGQLGRDWMIREFSWSRTAEMLERTYEWLLGRKARPAWVATD